jgi:cytochrome P450
VDEVPRLQRLARALRELLGWTTDLRRAFVFATLGPDRLMAMHGFRRQEAEVEREVYEQIATRRADPRLDDREDILSLLLRATDEAGRPLEDRDLRDELMTLLLAGHETTAALLAWAIHELARAPGLQDRLAEGGDELTDAVINEALRLWPPVPLVLRKLRVPLSIGGRDYPAGATLAPCMLILHRRPDLWPKPDAFSPERFLGGRRPAPGTFLPFGGGVRRCVGAAFAQFEARIVLGELVRTLRLEAPARREPVWRRGIVLVPARGARVRVSRRA